MTSLFSNPELLRNVRSQLRSRKMLATAAICAFLSISIAYLFSQRPSPTADWARDLLMFVLSAQALVLAVGGSIACLNSVFREKERNSFDFQRMTGLTPLELAVGKLLGAPIFCYFVCLCLMPVSIFAAALAHCRASFYVAAYVVLVVSALAFHALCILISVLSIRGSQTGAIILVILILWSTSMSGLDSTNRGVFRLSSMSPFFSVMLVGQTTWNVGMLEKKIQLRDYTYETNGGMTDVFFGWHVHHVPVALTLDFAFIFWFLLAGARNIKRDPGEYEVYSPAQSVLFALFLNFLAIAFFNWHVSDRNDSLSFLLSLDAGIVILLGLTLLRNRERMRRIVRARAGAGLWLDEVWPSPLLFVAALATGGLIAVCALWYQGSPGNVTPRFVALRVLFLALWIVRDQQYLQWMSLRQGRSPLVVGVLYLVIFYVVATTLLTAFDCFKDDRLAFTALFLPTPIYNLNPATFAERPAIWVAGYLLQIAAIGFFISLQRKRVAGLAPQPGAPAEAASAPA